MKTLISVYIVLFLSILASAKSPYEVGVLKFKTIRIAVIDTGVNKNLDYPLCKDSHKSFFGDDIDDHNGHGTVVTDLIHKYAGKAVHCFIIVKAFEPKILPNGRKVLEEKFVEAVRYVASLNVDIVNISGGGYNSFQEEREAILRLINRKVLIVAAAGNEGKDLDKSCDYYPACYSKDIVVVGQSDSKLSNHGKIVDVYAPGVVNLGNGETIQGTSFSTAFVTGKLVEALDKRYNGR